MTLGTRIEKAVANGDRPAHLYAVPFTAKIAFVVLCHVLYCLLAAPAGSAF